LSWLNFLLLEIIVRNGSAKGMIAAAEARAVQFLGIERV
jgi:hypothetical protein